MLNPLLLVEYTDIRAADFDDKVARVCYLAIQNMYNTGAKVLTVLEVDQELERTGGATAKIYHDGHGLDFLNWAYNNATPENFKYYYDRLKKYSLLRRLKKEKYDISEYYIEDKDIVNPLQETEIQQHLDNSSLEQILNSVESKYNIIRNDYLNSGHSKGDPAEKINELIETLKKSPKIGPALEGDLFSSCCRGARSGCFYLKSASTSAGKTRTAVFDACRLAYPKRWSEDDKSFIQEINQSTGELRQPRKVLFIVTEMDKEELQTIMLAYLSGVDEDKIIRGDYEIAFSEEARVKYAAKIIQEYSGYFIIEEISEPDLNNVQSTIKKYATVDDVKYVFFDYIHTTPQLVAQFSRSNLREDVVLMLLSNELKQLAKDYNLFIFSATQVNAAAMGDDGEFKNESCIRGSKAVADKADVGFVMTRVTDKLWNSIMTKLHAAINAGDIPAEIMENRPTHVLDIYKMRRGRYKNVRIWTYLHLGTGYRKDLFITSADNTPMKTPFTIIDGYDNTPFDFEKEGEKDG